MIKVKKLAALAGHEGSIYTICEGIEPGTIFSAGSDKIIAEWNLQDFIPQLFTAKCPSTIYALGISRSKQLLAAGSANGELHIINKYTQKEIKYIKLGAASIFDILFIDERELLVIASADGTITLLSSVSFGIISQLKPGNAKIRQLLYDKSNERVLAASSDGTIYFISLHDLSISKQLNTGEDAVNCIYIYKGQLLAGTKNARLLVYDFETLNLLKDIPAHNFAIYSIVGHPEGNWIATGSRDKTIKIWDPSKMEVLVRIDKEKHGGHVNSVNKLIWHPYKNILISGSDDRSILAWEILNN